MLKGRYVTFLIKKKSIKSITYIEYIKKHNNINSLVYYNRISQKMAGVKGLEPSTYRVTGDRSNQLSYTPPLRVFLVGSKGLEPLTPSV